jgi:hypothetical protein
MLIIFRIFEYNKLELLNSKPVTLIWEERQIQTINTLIQL